MRRCLFAVAYSLVVASSSAQMTPAERDGLTNALFLANLAPDDLRMARQMPADPSRPLLIETCLSDPLTALDEMLRFHGEAQPIPHRMIRAASSLYGPTRLNVAVQVSLDPVPDIVPLEFRAPIEALARAIAKCNLEVRAAISKVPASARRHFIESLPRWAAQDADLPLNFITMPMMSSQEIILSMRNVDIARIRAAALDFSSTVSDQIPRLQSAARQNPFQGRIKFQIGKMACILSGVSNDVHDDRDAVLFVDLGGDDTYTGRIGAGVGYSAVAIDLAGNDRYNCDDLSLGAGILGVGLAYDWGGDDVIRTGSISCGAGLAGVGVFYKNKGDDLYVSRSMSQGFGAAGLGICLDSSGSDTYRCSTLSQGSSRFNGIGWLAEFGGDDTFRAAGSPSFSQASASGEQGAGPLLGGGIALLTNLGGKDLYQAVSCAQGFGEAGGFGSLYDASGDDDYVLGDSGQSFGRSLGAAFLADLAGDDSYTVRKGSAIGRSHGMGTAMLLDREGDDLYVSMDGALGLATSNSLSIIIESQGFERYGCVPGNALGARDSLSISIFADLNGTDEYGFGMEDGGALLSSSGAVAVDYESKGQAPSPMPEPLPVPGSAPAVSQHELDKLLADAAFTKGAKADKAVRQLAAMGLPALESLVNHRLASISDSEARILGILALHIGLEGRNLIALKVGDKDDAIAASALAICVDSGISECSAVLVQALDRPALQRLASKAAGDFGNQLAVPLLMVLCTSSDQQTVLHALQSLAKLGDPQSSGTAQALLDQRDALIRGAAIKLLAKFPSAALTSAKILLREAEPKRARIGCMILEQLDSEEAIQLLGESLADPRPGVRIQAMVGLAGRCPPEKRAQFLALRADFDLQVRMVAKLLSPGR